LTADSSRSHAKDPTVGYFKHKRDRARARRTIRELHDAGQAGGEWSEWLDETP